MNIEEEILNISLVQSNFKVGDLEGNAKKILSAYKKSIEQGANLVVCSELSLCGYPLEDLALNDNFQKKSYDMLNIIAKDVSESGLIIGTILANKDSNKPYNVAVLLQNGKISQIYKKADLPNYGVFDEKRIFSASEKISIINFNNIKLGILICEDLWNKDISSEVKSLDAEILISLNASPFELNKQQEIISIANTRTKNLDLPLVYVNQVGGQDELVFLGSSFCMDHSGNIINALPKWEESIKTTRWKKNNKHFECIDKRDLQAKEDFYLDMYNALKIGLKDYIEKNNFKGVLIGFSGGIDSAMTACIAKDTLGQEQVQIVMMPSKFTSKETLKDAKECAKLLDLCFKTVDIEPIVDSFSDLLSEPFTGLGEDVSKENIQSRVRANILMLLSNKSDYIVLSTGNKSEMATGYATLYGDMCGGYNVLKDIYKTQLYELAKWRNNISPSIPKNIIEKAPTAELKENQKDEDTLPPYEILDKILYGLIELNQSTNKVSEINSIDKNTVDKIAKMLKSSEYKRFQSTLGVKITSKYFGKDRRYPVTNHFIS